MDVVEETSSTVSQANISSLTQQSWLDGSQSVAEAYVCGGQQDAQSGSAGVHGGSGLTLLQLQVEIEQQDAQELFDLVDGEVSSGTHGGAGPERHAVILQLLTVLVEVCLLSAVLDVAVEPERLMVQTTTAIKVCSTSQQNTTWTHCDFAMDVL